jgi:hypothetical protein
MKLSIELDFGGIVPTEAQKHDAVDYVATMICQDFREGELVEHEPDENDPAALPYRGWWKQEESK